MKLKINKACDLSSISVLPPHSRISSGFRNGPETSSIFNRSQGPYQLQSQQQQQSQQSFSQGISSQRGMFSQLQSQQQQQSQQSFSQGISSQRGMFSQLSQNSQDDNLTIDQRFGSQDRETSIKRVSSMPPVNFTREDNPLPLSRSSTNKMRKWSSALPDQKCQISEELEHRMGTIENSLSRFEMILDSVQSDIMQVNKVTKEVTLEMESMHQKLIVHGNSLQAINKAQEDIKASVDGGFKAISDQFNQCINQQSLPEISVLLSSLPEKIETFISKLQKDLSKTFANDMQTLACSLKAPSQKNPTPTVLPQKAVSCQATQPGTKPHMKPAVHTKVQQDTRIPKVEMGTWNSVKREQANGSGRVFNKGPVEKGTLPTELDREWRVVIESDEEIDGGFSCLLEEKEAGVGNYSLKEARKETERILRKARRRKRKHNVIIIN